jgi:redox-sensitive bicupin YhaK (pirin superfamily)
MTAGRGIVHAEMFPLRERDAGNPTELFQVWLNLPRADKMVEPYFTMLWGHTIPEHVFRDDGGRTTRVVAVAGPLDGKATLPSPPNSWAARPDAGVAIWTIVMAPGARWTLPAAAPGVRRTLYFFRGSRVGVGDHEQTSHAGLVVRGDAPVTLENGPDEGELLLLQGRPIAEPVAHHGPFVMNTRHEIQQAFADYQRTGFGGWPWPSDGPVHAREQGRFAIHADGRREEPR